MLTRTISAVIGIGVFLGLCFAGTLPYTIAVTLVAALGIVEFVSAQKRAPAVDALPRTLVPPARLFAPLNPPLVGIGIVFPAVVFLLLSASPALLAAYALVSSALVLCGIGLVAHTLQSGRTLGWFRAFYGLVGLGYIGALFGDFVLLRGLPGRLTVSGFHAADRGAWLMLFVAVCVWATDTFAYLIGRAVGRHKLAPKLSPGKTVEGAVGGLLGAMGAGMAFGHWLGLPTVHGLAVGALAGLLGPLGDLFESALKRELDIKDFGRALPGHGGALDRFDSLLFVAPFAYLYLRFVMGL